MHRLTKYHEYMGEKHISVDRDGGGIICSNFCTSCGKADCEYIRKALFKLAEYENTGLTPKQMREIDRLYAEKCKELSEVGKKIEELSDEYLQEAQNYANKGDKTLQRMKEHVVFALMRLAGAVSD